MRQVEPDAAVETRVSEIKWMAIAEIATGRTGMDAQLYYNEIQGLKRRPLSDNWLEASIMLACIAQIRPSKTIANLAKLRSSYTKRDAVTQFERFETLMQEYLSPMVLTNHGYHKHSFATADHDAVWEQVDAHLRTLRRAGYEVFLNSGTLLGVVRDERLIDHDDDIDLAVMLNATTTEEAAQEWKDLREVLKSLDLFEADVRGMPGVYKLKPAGKIQIDLFPAWTEKDRAYVYPHTSGSLSVEDVMPLQPCALTGQAIPADPELMLVENYGAEWRKPDPLFKFPWTAANKRFAPFLERLN